MTGDDTLERLDAADVGREVGDFVFSASAAAAAVRAALGLANIATRGIDVVVVDVVVLVMVG